MQSARQYITEKLSGLYSDNEIRNFYYLIIENLTGLKIEQILANKNNELSPNQRNSFIIIVNRLYNFEPIQHIFGSTVFYRLPFKVNKHTLIPRPETEELVDWILSENPDKKNLSAVDIGTGSGCIAISIAKNKPDWKVSAFDISDEAIAIAKGNAVQNDVRIFFQKEDVLSSNFVSNKSEKFDIIVSNPPYICETEKTTMSPNVLNYEPSLALFVSDSDPLIFYRQIALFAKKNLSENGQLYFEINQRFGKETVDLLAQIGFKEIVLRKDFFGNNRMILAKQT
jgi:release factor glutamine methyltransferase